MEPKDKKKYTVYVEIEAVEKVKELLGKDKSISDVFQSILNKVIETKEGNSEKVELDSSKIFDFNSLQSSVSNQNKILAKLIDKYSETLKRKDDPLFDFLVEGYWSMIDFDDDISTVNDYKTYQRGDIVETDTGKLYLVIETLKSNKIKLVHLPLNPESSKFEVDLNVETSTKNVRGYDVITLLWRK